MWVGVADSWEGPYREWKAEPATHPENEDPASNQGRTHDTLSAPTPTCSSATAQSCGTVLYRRAP